MIHLNKCVYAPTVLTLLLLSSCGENPSLSSTSQGSLPSSSSTDSSLISSDSSSSSNSSSLIYTPEEEAFRFIGQQWSTLINQTSEITLDDAQSLNSVDASGEGLIGFTDAIGFRSNQHGGRMITSLHHYYPTANVEGVSYDGLLLNNPYFQDQPDYRYQGLYVDNLDHKVTANLYAMALFLESHQERMGPKIFASASSSATPFFDQSLSYDTWSSAAWREVESLYGTQVNVPLHGYQLGKWLHDYGNEQNVLYMTALENNTLDASYEAIDCNQPILANGMIPSCGSETYSQIVTGYGLEHTLFVGHYDANFDVIQGLATGPYLAHTLYSEENFIDDSNSHTVPNVAGFLNELIGLRRLSGLSELTSSEWKQLLLSTSDYRTVNFLARINTSVGQVVNERMDEPVHILNKDNATECALEVEWNLCS